MFFTTDSRFKPARYRLALLVLLLSTGIGCVPELPSMPPGKALQEAADHIDQMLASATESTTPVIPDALETPDDIHHITLWYGQHSILGKTLNTPAVLQAFHRLHPEITLHCQFIGEWEYAIQKLTVAMASGDVPDIALVPRNWVGLLAENERLMPIDMLLSDKIIQDIHPQLRRLYTLEGHLYALPADAYCQVLFYNRNLIKTPPGTWQELQQIARSLRDTWVKKRHDYWPIGCFPYLPALWSAGGHVIQGGHCALREPVALESLQLLLSFRDNHFLYPFALGNPKAGFDAFLHGHVACTVASSEWITRLKNTSFPVGIAPVPGKNKPITTPAGQALIVFRRYAEAKQIDLGQVLAFLTGASVQGKAALASGSLPLRISLCKQFPPPAGLLQAVQALHAEPLSRSWQPAVDILRRYLGMAYFYKPGKYETSDKTP